MNLAVTTVFYILRGICRINGRITTEIGWSYLSRICVSGRIPYVSDKFVGHRQTVANIRQDVAPRTVN